MNKDLDKASLQSKSTGAQEATRKPDIIPYSGQHHSTIFPTHIRIHLHGAYLSRENYVIGQNCLKVKMSFILRSMQKVLEAIIKSTTSFLGNVGFDCESVRRLQNDNTGQGKKEKNCVAEQKYTTSSHYSWCLLNPTVTTFIGVCHNRLTCFRPQRAKKGKRGKNPPRGQAVVQVVDLAEPCIHKHTLSVAQHPETL